MGYTMSKLEIDSDLCDAGESIAGACSSQRFGEGSFEIDNEITHITKLRTEPSEKVKKVLNSHKMMPISVVKMLSAREANLCGRGNFSLADRCHVLGRYLPANGPYLIDRMNSRAYVSQFSADGSLFVAGFQGSHIRTYDVDNGWRVKKNILARSLRWTITDTSLSPNQCYLVYASMSPIVHIVNVNSGSTESHANITEIHEGLDFSVSEDWEHSFGIFSVKFSTDGRELVAGSSDESIYVYDLEANKISLRISAHSSDVNTVTFADDTGHLVYSGSDDNLCKIWDRRCFISKGRPAGILVGHIEGITYIDSRGDGRYLISNGKDQTTKLWDIRRMTSTISCSRPKTNYWDYRWTEYPASAKLLRHPSDQSLATYRGHSVLHTLIRCYFSPAHSTGQRYIYTGSSDNSVYIYDVVFTDELLIHQNLRKHLAMAYSISSEKLTAHDCITCDIGIILELVSAHFLISYCEETTSKGLSHLKVSCKLMAMESPKLSLAAALALLGTPAISSAPYMLQSHMIFLVSKCVAASSDLNLTAMYCYLSAFKQSVILYTCLAPHFLLHHDATSAKRQSRSFVTEHRRMENDLGLSFDSYVRMVTYDAVNLQSQKLVDHFSKESSVFLSRTKAETITICMTYIEENKHAIQEQWREETCLMLNFIIQRIAGETGKGQLQMSEEVNWQEVYYGAALLNLMGSSLLQIIMVLSEQGRKTLRDYDLCRDYLFVSGVINLFVDRFVDQYVVGDIPAAYSTKWPQTNPMLAHVTSLLFYAIDRRIFPLWEVSILVMIAVMNLLVFEEGNLDAVRTVFGCEREISSSQLPASKISMGTSIRSSSIKIASDFQKIHFFQSKRMTARLSHETSRMDISSSQTEGRDGPAGTSLLASTNDVDHDLSSDKNGRCNGEGYLKCILEDCNIPDWDDLADFIETKPERDYAIWLRERGRYNKRKNKRLAVSRHQRKKMLRRKLTKGGIER